MKMDTINKIEDQVKFIQEDLDGYPKKIWFSHKETFFFTTYTWNHVSSQSVYAKNTELNIIKTDSYVKWWAYNHTRLIIEVSWPWPTPKSGKRWPLLSTVNHMTFTLATSSTSKIKSAIFMLIWKTLQG